MQTYELMLVFDPGVLEKDEKKIFELIKKNLREKGKISSKEKLGKKKLSYPIKKKMEGVYWLLILEISGKEIKTLTNKLNLENKLLRHMFVLKED